jgi:hypothetical protein
LLAGGEFGAEYFRHGSGHPVVVRLAGQVFEAQDSDRGARFNRGGSGAASGSAENPKTNDNQTNSENKQNSSDERERSPTPWRKDRGDLGWSWGRDRELGLRWEIWSLWRDGGGVLFHGKDKSIAEFGKSLDITRYGCGIIEDGAQLFNCGVKAVLEIDKGVRRPELLLELFTGNDLTRMFEK